ncbi:hypothetical protein FJY94_04080 [Candidatus Kaiserbacteria bacterium]|nr:hypothetical protein [Candidatus Kaiserbacteria bacterium]
MSMMDTLARFGEQFAWQPEVVNADTLAVHGRFVVCGMGGSHLGAWLIAQYGNKPEPIHIHRDYGLPNPVPPGALIILSSYSGNTEEVLDAAQAARGAGLPIAAVTTGGKLLAFAQEHSIPYVQMPQTQLEPRLAIGFSMLALARLMQDAPLEALIRDAGLAVMPESRKEEGLAIGQSLVLHIPWVWSSRQNESLSYIWKIQFNESAKTLAASHCMPELAHNELSGFDVVAATSELTRKAYVVMLEDAADHPRVQKRMQIARQILEERQIGVTTVRLAGQGFFKAFDAAILADWAATALAEHYNVPNPETPLIAEFKRRLDV